MPVHSKAMTASRARTFEFLNMSLMQSPYSGPPHLPKGGPLWAKESAYASCMATGDPPPAA